ncbi:hypothetical protein pb186bvf_006960 [Paramecium bursaria]
MSDNFKFGYSFKFSQLLSKIKIEEQEVWQQPQSEEKDRNLPQFQIVRIMPIFRKCLDLIINQCSFAHGEGDLKQQPHQNGNLKTKPCKNYHKIGGCSYGIRLDQVVGLFEKAIKKERSTIHFCLGQKRQDKVRRANRYYQIQESSSSI